MKPDRPTLVVSVTVREDGSVAVKTDFNPTAGPAVKTQAIATLVASTCVDFFDGDPMRMALMAALEGSVMAEASKTYDGTKPPTCGHAACEHDWATRNAPSVRIEPDRRPTGHP